MKLGGDDAEWLAGEAKRRRAEPDTVLADLVHRAIRDGARPCRRRNRRLVSYGRANFHPLIHCLRPSAALA